MRISHINNSNLNKQISFVILNIILFVYWYYWFNSASAFKKINSNFDLLLCNEFVYIYTFAYGSVCYMNNAKSNHIEGIQARYYLPVMVPFMLSIVIFMSKYKNNSQSIQKINTLVPCKTHVLYAVILPLYFIFTMYSVSAIFVF